MAIAPESIDFHAGPDRQAELACIRLQVVGHCVLAGISRRDSGKRHARQPVVATRREQPQAVPSLPPAFTNSLILVDDQKRQAAPLEVITNGEPGLPASDHQRPNMM
jgi:hypothetical protein